MHSTSICRGTSLPLALALMTSPVLSLGSGAQSAPLPQSAIPATRPVLPQEPLAQPSSEWAGLPASTRAAVNSSTDKLLFAESSDGALWVRGTSFKARFDGTSASIVPFFGSDAPQNYPLELRVISATLGGEAIDAKPSRRATLKGETVSIDHGAFVEEYDLTTKSLEQRFVFEQLRGAGDLVVRMDATSELMGSDEGATLRFENALGAVDYGEAFAIDANGKRIALDSTLVDGAIELRVPASFVENAALPLVIDPLITAYTAGGTSLHDLYPDVAYDVSTDRWCIVWTSIWSATDHDAYARLATGAYQLLPGLISLDFTTDTWTTPRVANNGGGNQFLACFAVVPSGSGLADIRGQFIDPATASAGAPFQISPLDGAYRNLPDIGGDPYTGSASFYCVVWQRWVSSTNVDIEARLVSRNATMTAVIPLENTAELHELPSISNSTGIDVGDGTVGWTVTWQRQFANFDHDIYAARLSWNGNITHPIFPIDISSWDDTNPVASTILDSTALGAPRPYMVAFERNFGDHDIVGAVMQGASVLHKTNLVGGFDPSAWYREQLVPSIDSDGAQFLLAFTERDNLGSSGDLYVCDYFWDGALLGACEQHASLAGSVADENDVAIHSMASSGGARGKYLAAYPYASASHGYDVIGALWQGCESMVESVCDGDGSGGSLCPCLNNGSGGHGCANSVNAEGAKLTFTGSANVSSDDAAFHAVLMPPNVFCLFFQGTSLGQSAPFGNGLRCVNGTTTRFPLKQCDSNGDTSYPAAGDQPISVIGQIPAIGATRYYQAWYRDPASTCVSTFNLTNALRVTWTP